MSRDQERIDAIIADNNAGLAAFHDAEFDVATEHWARACARLTPAQEHMAPALYENLGLAAFNARRYDAAARAFRRALGADVASRAQSLLYLVWCSFRLGRVYEARRLRDAFEDRHGAGSHGLTDADLLDSERVTREARRRFIAA